MEINLLHKIQKKTVVAKLVTDREVFRNLKPFLNLIDGDKKKMKQAATFYSLRNSKRFDL